MNNSEFRVGIFINLLYDAEYYDISIKTIQLALSRFTPNEKFIKLKYDFIEATFKPSLFALFSRNSKIFKEIIHHPARNICIKRHKYIVSK